MKKGRPLKLLYPTECQPETEGDINNNDNIEKQKTSKQKGKTTMIGQLPKRDTAVKAAQKIRKQSEHQNYNFCLCVGRGRWWGSI